MRSVIKQWLVVMVLYGSMPTTSYPIDAGSYVNSAWNLVKNHPFLVGTSLVCALGLAGCVSKKTSTAARKHVSVYYESKESTKLVAEPVEWPVKAVYADNIFGWIASKFAGVFGGYVTKRAGNQMNNPDLKDKYLAHYRSFYKDHINMAEYNEPVGGFRTFNDWFIRTLKNPEKDRPMAQDSGAIASPADSKVLIIPDISLDAQVTIKEQQFDVARFLNNARLAQQYEHGVMMIFRLSPHNYHRYHYPFDCFVRPERFIDGKYHSVNPRAFVSGVKPLTENKRSYEILMPEIGKKPVVMVQVGATAVASIVNHHMDYSAPEPVMKDDFVGRLMPKGSEIGYFQFGGSTVVLLFPKDAIIPDERIVQNSNDGYETAVKVRETIARWK